MAPFSYLIFDLDGTILDTILDISRAMNEALRKCGYDFSYSPKETKRLVGDGADMAVRRALEFNNADLRGFQALKEAYMPLYKKMQNDNARPFPRLKEALSKAKEKGVKLFVVTNKPDALAKVVVPSHYGEGFFDDIIGVKEGGKVKPDPQSLNELIERHGIDRGKALYVGDSHVDIETANNGGLPCALCLWGYDVYDDSLKKRAAYLLKEPEDILSLI